MAWPSHCLAAGRRGPTAPAGAGASATTRHPNRAVVRTRRRWRRGTDGGYPAAAGLGVPPGPRAGTGHGKVPRVWGTRWRIRLSVLAVAVATGYVAIPATPVSAETIEQKQWHLAAL